MPVMITLNKIRAASPCADGWETVLKTHEHLGMDTPFPLSSVLDSNGLEDTLWCFKALPEHIEILKRFALWCAREVQHLMKDEGSLNVLDVAERYLDDNATLEELKVADTPADGTYAAHAARATAAFRASCDYYVIAACVAYAAALADVEQKQIDKLREMLDESNS